MQHIAERKIYSDVLTFRSRPGKENFTTSDRTRIRAALIVATLSSFIGPFMGSTVNVALPSIGKDFAMGAVTLGWINTSFLLSAATFLIPFGRLGDIYGKKSIFLSGVVVLMASSAALALSVSGAMMITCRVFQGFASAMVFATSMPILISVVPPQQRGRAIGIATAAVYLGLSIGPFVGGIITQQIGWRYIFWLNVPLSLILLSVTYFMLNLDEVKIAGVKFDLAGSALLGVSLLLTMYGFSTLPSLLAAIMIAVGLIGIVTFVRYESRTKDPVLDIGLFRNNTVFGFSIMAALINYAATFAVSFILSLYLQKLRGLSPRDTGLIMIAQPVIQAIFSPYAGKLSDKVEPRTLASLGMAITAVGLALMILISSSTSMVFIVACMMILGFGFALFSSPNTNAIMSAVSRDSLGIAGATVGAARQIGMMVSMGIVMMIISLYIGKSDIIQANFDSFVHCVRTVFAVFAIACFGGVFASLARGKMGRG
jgi:EmrB/QacA subfamily drug resistance transporter